MYQLDALSANWGIHLAAYTDWVTYTVEWVPGNEGYVRWEVEGHPVFEIAAATVTNPPQDAAQMNPKKIMIEEPMYIIFNPLDVTAMARIRRRTLFAMLSQ
ncbi:uncharacterized protein PITG_16259 [Phytophthora infestans T30-4]|uniref:GH16 domain-containing protein n=1 Tax=Phytophthora infestans (strain T30-4) TaxID=403677 RepID=D0NTH0_PHYIT|nr:uncharacterized protein PITG_16259 [Phytophthora infestans T30-4]EEY64921.1 conserved hypothetical protein [Phytophthora infestans T30-4]|eukprot:XP_002897651.1 conserved hypothetical protein [Phytophthora infestans T30-4]